MAEHAHDKAAQKTAWAMGERFLTAAVQAATESKDKIAPNEKCKVLARSLKKLVASSGRLWARGRAAAGTPARVLWPAETLVL